MKAPRFKNWFAKLSALNQPQRQQVLDALHPAAGLDQVVALIAQARAPARCCPSCGNERCHRHGFANDLQRFRCCACGRTFNDLSGTPLARLRHKAKWLAYSQCCSIHCPDARVQNGSAYTAIRRSGGVTAFSPGSSSTGLHRSTASSKQMKRSCSNRKKACATSPARHAAAGDAQLNLAFPGNSIAFWWHATGMAAPSMPSLAAAH